MAIKRTIILGLAAVSPLQAATITAMTSFGGGDGVLLPADYGGSTSTSTERHIAYNPATGNLVLVSRQTANRVDVISGTTGSAVKTMTAPAGGYTSAVLNITAVGVSADGQIFVTNLADGANGTAANQVLSVYKWGSESVTTAPTSATFTLPAGYRLGDSMDATGSGTGATLLLGYNDTAPANQVNDDGWAVIDAGLTTLTSYDPTAGSAASAFRLSIAAVDGDTLIGNQNGVTRIADYSSGSVSSVSTISGLVTTDRHVDVITIGGKQYLATLSSVDTATRNNVRVYELNGTAATLVASGNLIGTGNANGNGTGDIEWGAVTGDTATLYALNTNNGIQAFVFQVPEPGVAGLALLGLAAAGRRRR